MSVPDLVHAAKSRALKIITSRIFREKTEFATSKFLHDSVKQFSVKGVGTIDVPISEPNWFKLRDIAQQSSYMSVEEQQTNHSWTIDGEMIFVETPPINSKDWKVLLWNVLTPLIMDLDVSNISANLSRLILCKAGEMYRFKSPAKIKSDHLATLFLQLPMENGNGAGSVKVSLGSRNKEFVVTSGCSSGSAIAYVFYPEYHFELKPVSTKHRLILEFDLFRSALPLAIELKTFEEDGKLIREALSGLFFQSTGIRPDALLIPLDHQYNQQNVFLKGRDAVISKLFQSIGDFHVHLALFTDDPDQSTARVGEAFRCLRNLEHRAFQILSGSKDVKHLTHWISYDGSPLNFEFLCSAETEGNSMIPQPITRTEPAKVPQFDENTLFTTALAVWPILNTKIIEDKLQHFEHWNLLRKRAGLPPLTVTGSRSEMSSIANYIRNNMECLTEDKILLAFQTICLQLQLHDISLDVLQAVAEYTKWPNPSVPCSLIAEAVDIAEKFNPPWNQVPDLFFRLSNVDLWAKIGFCSALAETMNGRQMLGSFASLAQLTHGLFLVTSQDENLRRTHCSHSFALYMFCHTMMRLEKMKAKSITQPFVKHLRFHFSALSINDLLRLVVQIPSDFLNVLLESDPCRSLYRSVWYLLRAQDFSCESFLVMTPPSVVQSVNGLLCLKEPRILDWFVSKMTLLLFNNGQCEFLQTIFSSAELISVFNSTDYGKRALEVLRSVQIIDLYRRQQPVFTWRRPTAVVDGHPEVQNFLRSSERFHRYTNFKSLAEARAFAEILEKNQWKADAKYCVRATPGEREGGAFCLIVKTRGRFEKPPDDKTTETTKELKNFLNNDRRTLVAEVEGNDSCPAKRLKLEQSDGTVASCPELDKSVAVSQEKNGKQQVAKSVKPPKQQKKPKCNVPPQVINIQGEMNKWFRLRDVKNPAESVAVRHLFQELINDNMNVTEYMQRAVGMKLPCNHLLENYLPKLRECLRLGSVHIYGIDPPVFRRTPNAETPNLVGTSETKPARKVYMRSSVTASSAITSEKSMMKVEVSNQTITSEQIDISNQASTSEKIDVSQTNEVIVEAIVKKEPVVIDLT